MKPCYGVCFAFIFLSFCCVAQNDFYNNKINQTTITYLNLGVGVNHTGVFSIGTEIPVAEKFSVFCDLGVGGWGVKFGAGFSYYFKNIAKGGAVSLGYYRVSGSADKTIDVLNEAGDEIPIFLNATSTINATYSHHIKIGKKHKLSFFGGYGVAMFNKDRAYETMLLNDPVDDFSRRYISLLHPDGFILGAKFMFGLGGR